MNKQIQTPTEPFPSGQGQQAQIKEEKTLQVIPTKLFPFALIYDGEFYEIVAGQSRMSQKRFKTKLFALLYLYARPMEILINFICQTTLIINKDEHER